MRYPQALWNAAIDAIAARFSDSYNHALPIAPCRGGGMADAADLKSAAA